MTQATEMNKTLLVVLALYKLGGESDLEHIAVKVHEMFPQQFCWRSYPQFPDKDAVRVHLSEAKKASFGALVADKDLRHERRGDGTYTKRFALTSSGVERARGLERAIEMSGGATASENTIDFRRLVDPILDSEAYQQYRNGMSMGVIGKSRFLAAFRLFSDASPFVITGRLTRAEAAVDRLPESSQREHLRKFIQEGRNAHVI
jgi:hypothetical protein